MVVEVRVGAKPGVYEFLTEKRRMHKCAETASTPAARQLWTSLPNFFEVTFVYNIV